MKIARAESRSSKAGPEAYFTGDVWQSPVIGPDDAPAMQALWVTFTPGARTAWHTHPKGQTLYVTQGIGRVQSDGGPVLVIRPGDTVWIPPDERHWHGAAPDSLMTHLAIQEGLDGSYVTWLDHVTDADYAADPAE